MANEKETVKLKIFNQEDRLNVAAILIKKWLHGQTGKGKAYRKR